MPKPKLNVHVVSSLPRGPRKSKKTAKLEAKLPPYLRMLVDPFSVPPEGAARPDHNSAPTVIWKEQGSFNATLNADGNLWLAFTPSPVGLYYTYNFTAGTTTAISAFRVDAPNLTELALAFQSFRPYALAVEVDYIGQADLCKGVLGTCTTCEFLPFTSNVTSIIDEGGYEESALGDKMAAVNRFHDNDNFQNLTTEAYGAGVAPASVLNVVVLGGPASTACVRVRWHLIAEYTAGPTKLMSRSVAHSPAHPAQISAGATIVGKKAAVAFDQIDPISKLTTQAMRLAEVGGALNGLWQASKPVVSLLAEFGALVA